MNPENYSTTSEEIKLASKRSSELKAVDFQEKRIEERQILRSLRICPSRFRRGEVSIRLSHLNPAALKSELATRFYDPNVLRAAGCIISSFNTEYDSVSLSANERLREYITNLKQIGSESVSGFALNGDMHSDRKEKVGEDMFVVKAPRDVNKRYELVHESIVGLLGTNTLRQYVPNYAYVYGAFNCTSPFIQPDGKKVISWCNSKDKGAVTFIIYESITPSISFDNFAGNCTPEGFMKYYLQTMLALRVGQRRIAFCHYDLHGENVLLRTVPNMEKMYIPYETRNGLEYIETDGVVATIIDYGFSHVMVSDGKRFKSYGYTDNDLRVYGVYNDSYIELFDPYKLLLMLLRKMIGENRDCFEAIKDLVKFFNTKETPEEVITKQNEMYYYFPKNEKTVKLRIDDWIEYCRDFMKNKGMKDPITPVKPEDVPILGCNLGCESFTYTLNKSGIDFREIYGPDSFLKFFDMITSLNTKRDRAIAKKYIVEASDIQQIINQTVESFYEYLGEAFEDSVNKMLKYRNAMLPFEIYKLSEQYFLNPDILSMAKTQASRVVKFIDAFQRANLEFRAILYTRGFYPDKPDEKENPKLVTFDKIIDSYSNIIEKATYFMNNIKKVLNNDMKFVNKDMYKNNPNLEGYSWYWKSYPTVANMVS